MTLDTSRTVTDAINQLTTEGFGTSHPEWKGNVMVEAIISAVLEELKANAVVKVTGGSSSGDYKIT